MPGGSALERASVRLEQLRPPAQANFGGAPGRGNLPANAEGGDFRRTPVGEIAPRAHHTNKSLSRHRFVNHRHRARCRIGRACTKWCARDLVKAAIEGRLPRAIGVASLCDAPAEWSRQYCALGLPSPQPG